MVLIASLIKCALKHRLGKVFVCNQHHPNFFNSIEHLNDTIKYGYAMIRMPVEG